MLKKYLQIHPEVEAAVKEGKPVVALESTIISHGMPYPQNVEMASRVEEIIREKENSRLPDRVRDTWSGSLFELLCICRK